MCMRALEDWKVDVRLQVPKRAGQPGMGVVPDSEGQDQAALPRALLLSAARDTEGLYPFCCQIEQGQGLEEDDPDPRPVLPDLALGRACVSVYCVCTVVCVCVCFPGLCVLALLLLDSPPWVASFLWASVFWELRQDV